MIEAPHIVHSPLQLTAMIHLRVPRELIRVVMRPGLNEIMNTLADQRIAPAGPWLTHQLQTPSDVFDFEICVPVDTPVTPAGRVVPGRIDATTVARTVLRGPYEELGTAWAELNAWIVAQRHTPRQDFWERYVVGPEATADSAEWHTELNRPLVT